MTKLDRLMHLTNAGMLACMEALGTTDSFDEAVEFLKPVSKKLKRGMFVTITNPIMTPYDFSGKTFKILKVVKRNKPVWIDRIIGDNSLNYVLRVFDVLLLEDTTYMQLGSTYLNVPFFMEDPLAIVLATKEEKLNYHKNKSK